jgi:hypothetical protein
MKDRVMKTLSADVDSLGRNSPSMRSKMGCGSFGWGLLDCIARVDANPDGDILEELRAFEIANASPGDRLFARYYGR